MDWIISAIIAVLICGGIAVVGIIARAFLKSEIAKDNGSGYSHKESNESALAAFGWLTPGALGFFILWMTVSTFFASVHQVDAGHIGVIKTFGEYTDTTGEGPVLTLPWQDFEERSVKIETIKIPEALPENERTQSCGDTGLPCIVGFSEEQQDVYVRLNVNYTICPSFTADTGCVGIDRNQVLQLFRSVGDDYARKLINDRIVTVVKESTRAYPITKVAENRDLLRNKILTQLQSELANWGVTITDVYLNNVDFDPQYKASIRAVQEAEQNAERAVQDANAERTRAQGEADAIKIVADQQAAGNQALNATLTPELIQYRSIEKLSDNISIALIPSDGNIFLDANNLAQAAAAAGAQ